MNLRLKLAKSLLVPDFPSGSSINWYHDKIYLIGDDANNIMILDENYRTVDSIQLFEFPDKRIPKSEKVDLETSTILTLEGNDYLLVMGSASKKKRMKLMLIALDQERGSVEVFQYKDFSQRLNAMGIQEINIEGSAFIKNRFVLANKGNEGNPVNSLIFTEKDFWQQQHVARIAVSELVVQTNHNGFVGISELYYLETKDTLFCLFTSERTNNAYDDGAIGDSYLGWIEDVSNKINSTTIQTDGMINLAKLSDEFQGEKIEGICIERIVNNECTTHLISDNDQGHSKLFKLTMLMT